MRFFYSDAFNVPLPEGHRFPGGKYAMLREKLLAHGIFTKAQLKLSIPASIGDVGLAHTDAYIAAVLTGGLSPQEQRRIGLPWSDALARRSLITVGGAIASARAALETGFSAQLAGGTHHAHANFGAGYCVFNDFAVTALKALSERWVERVAIVDLDVHQGDGNASILGGRSGVFILDVYCEKNFPFRKVEPHLAVPLPAHTGDDAYLAALREGMEAVLAFEPGLILYQAGVDPLHHDALGHLDLTYEGLAARDAIVFDACREAAIPLSLGIGGGYSKPICYSVEAYANVLRTAKRIYRF